MHQAAVAYRREKKRKGKFEAQNASAQIAVGNRNRMARAEGHVIKNPAIFTKCNFALGAAIQVIEYRFRDALAGDGAEVFNANNSGGRDSASGSRHLQSQSLSGKETESGDSPISYHCLKPDRNGKFPDGRSSAVLNEVILVRRHHSRFGA
jgi:hypothetical protein